MRFRPTILGQLLEPISRRQFTAIVERHDGDAYAKSFRSWDHLVALIFAQFSALDTLRGLETGCGRVLRTRLGNANCQHHYHLASGPLARSTLADANKRRPAEVLADAFALIAGQIDRRIRHEGQEMLRLIDSTPIPLGKLCAWAKSNGRIRGMKMHVVYDPKADYPRILDITHANVNDAQVGRTVAIEPGATYVFDKGYCHYGWWAAIDAAKSWFVTRPKTNMRLDVVKTRRPRKTQGDGFLVVSDEDVVFASKGDSKLPIRLRRICIKRENGQKITLLTNDLKRSAVAIGALYKGRWQIELLFRWIKQNLKIRKFLGNNDNAIRLQLFAAMIAFALLRIAANVHRVRVSILRFTDLVGQCLLDRRQIADIERPPPVNPSAKRDRSSPNQLSFTYA